MIWLHMFEFPPGRDTAGYVSSGRPRPAGGGVVKTRENFTVISKSGRRRLQEVVV